MKHQRVYAMLKRHGHSAVKALEIILCAKRGDPYALMWIRALRQL